jgi:CHASE3 domain sensor protein
MKPASRHAPRKLCLDPIISLSVAAVLLFLALSGFVAYLNLRTLRADNQKIIHSHNVIVALDTLFSSVQDAETGQRGFLLTGNEKYLDPYATAIAVIPSQISDIARLTSDNPQQKTRISILRGHVAGKLAELRQTIELRRIRGAETAMAVVRTDRGKAQMDAIRSQLAAMAQVEADLRAPQRRTRRHRGMKRNVVTGIVQR